MAEYNPFQSILNPNASRAGLYDMRMMQAANRMEAPFERSHSYAHQGLSGNPMLSQLMGAGNTPDLSSFTFDPAMRQAAMDAGVTPLAPNQVKNNVILPNTGFFGRHPGLSSALEGGIFGALASHGGATVGDSIQGALEGMVGGKQVAHGMWLKQFEGPFEAGSVLEGLQDRGQKRALQEADIQHLRALNEHYVRGDDEKAAALENTQRHQEIMEANALERTRISNAAEAEKEQHDIALEDLKQRALDRAAANKPPRMWGIDTKTGKYTQIAEGMDSGTVKPVGALESDSKKAAADKQAWLEKRKPSDIVKYLGNDPNVEKYFNDPDAAQEAFSRYYDKHFGQGATSYTWNPAAGRLEQDDSPSSLKMPSTPTRKAGSAGSMLESITGR